MADTNEWSYEPRGYIHFDSRPSEDHVTDVVTDPAAVTRRSFWPFIHFVIEQPRYRPEEGRVEMKERPICYAAHLDAAIYSYYSHRLSQSYESQISELSESILAYRSLGKSNIHFAKEAFDEISERGDCLALAFDIRGFFDNLNHSYLKQQWCGVTGTGQLPEPEYKIFRSISRYAQVDRDEVYSEFGLDSRTARHRSRICSASQFRKRVRGNGLIQINQKRFGIPQGSPISAVLSNVYMMDFDRRMNSLAESINGSYRRYSDDILWLLEPRHETTVADAIRQAANDARLELNDKKTDRVVFGWEDSRIVARNDSGRTHLQYLGFTFDGEHARVRPSSISRYFRKMKRAVQTKLKAAKDSGDYRLFKNALYDNYSHLGSRNFVSYVYRAAEIFADEKIKRQVRNHWRALQREIRLAEDELATHGDLLD